MPFATVAVPHAAYRDLPTPQHRWLLMCLARYADRDGRCWPSMRQLAQDARMSKSSVQRLLADLSQLGVFSRSRRPGGRYRYEIDALYRPMLHRSADRQPLPRVAVPNQGKAVPYGERQKAINIKHIDSPDDLRQMGALHSPSGIHNFGNSTQVKKKSCSDHSRRSEGGNSKYSDENSGKYCGNYILHNDSSQWRARLAAWERSGGRFWPQFAGPPPNAPGCWVPPGLLETFQSRGRTG